MILMSAIDLSVVYKMQTGKDCGTIADLIAYRLRNDRIISRILDTKLESIFGKDFRMIVYKNEVAYAEHIALVKGQVNNNSPTPVRMHALNVLNDVLGEQTAGSTNMTRPGWDLGRMQTNPRR